MKRKGLTETVSDLVLDVGEAAISAAYQKVVTSKLFLM